MSYLKKPQDSAISARQSDPTPRAAPLHRDKVRVSSPRESRPTHAEILFAETAHILLKDADGAGPVCLDVMNRFSIGLYNAQYGTAIGFNLSLGSAERPIHSLEPKLSSAGPF